MRYTSQIGYIALLSSACGGCFLLAQAEGEEEQVPEDEVPAEEEATSGLGRLSAWLRSLVGKKADASGESGARQEIPTSRDGTSCKWLPEVKTCIDNGPKRVKASRDIIAGTSICGHLRSGMSRTAS